MKIEKSLLAGSSAMLVLKLLDEGDKYGYQITDELARRSQNVFEMKSGTLYPLLHSLEQKKLVTAYERIEGGRARRYYSITDEGRCALADKQEEWDSFTAAVRGVMGGALIVGA
ncbi:MAG: helix-turn-helix transcriptional regulator [Clostridia bacterium]|nr:helix-turn-helix transcriptional regulator [Clostridia bacterium]MBQ9994275.1 helix-turn-helix transcriptional regulator [Clostridia bacterium]